MSTINLFDELKNNPYPGRGIVMGRCGGNTRAIMAYWIMGRSENSRNRVFVETEDGIQTEAFDPSKMLDPSLIIYHPVRKVGDITVVTNGDQTDTVRDALVEGKTYFDALRTREFEPDGPNFTPRISGLMLPNGDYNLSILKTVDGDGSRCQRHFYEYSNPAAATGHFISTYAGDGNPLPSFASEPKLVSLDGKFRDLSQQLWESLNEDNKVSLFVRYVTIATGETDTVIYNKNSSDGKVSVVYSNK